MEKNDGIDQSDSMQEKAPDKTDVKAPVINDHMLDDAVNTGDNSDHKDPDATKKDSEMGIKKEPHVHESVMLDKYKKVMSCTVFPSSRALRIAIYCGVVILCGLIFAGGYFYGRALDLQSERLQTNVETEALRLQFENAHVNDIATIQERIVTDTWKEFKSQWYGFTITYPAEWSVRTVSSSPQKKAAVYRVGFYKPNVDSAEAVAEGYEVAVYDLKNTSELALTDEYPKRREGSEVLDDMCRTVTGHLYETGDYPAEEIYIPAEDECFLPTLFYSNVVGQYIYTITPVFAEVGDIYDPMVAATDRVPEYFVAVSQFANVDIVRPKPRPATPKFNAPMPATYKKDALGRLVCAKKNDKPGKSKDNNKGKIHLDMECCLDPDEYPNPHCYYDPAKYGKYMNKNTPPAK